MSISKELMAKVTASLGEMSKQFEQLGEQGWNMQNALASMNDAFANLTYNKNQVDDHDAYASQMFEYLMRFHYLVLETKSKLKDSTTEYVYCSFITKRPEGMEVYHTKDGKYLLPKSYAEVELSDKMAPVGDYNGFHQKVFFKTLEEAYDWRIRTLVVAKHNNPNDQQIPKYLAQAEADYNAYLNPPKKIKNSLGSITGTWVTSSNVIRW